MTYLYAVLTLALLALLAGGIVEQRRHERNLRAIPVRVLVNGIRGKSSITRLVAGALRGGDMRVVAKTTGTAARFIYPDGSEEPVFRKFNIANVAEQIGIVARAAAENPDALVMECMAVQPALQEVNQTKLIQSNIGVLCNVREDHLEEMGPTLDDVARSLSRSMPVGGVCITAESERLDVLAREAERRDCRLVAVDPESVSDEEMDRFDWFTFKENVAIAIAVAAEVGIGRDDALRGMWMAPPDPGVLTVETYHVGTATVRFANVFAANDPQSTIANVRELAARGAIVEPYHVLINCRPDRVERNGQMGSIVEELGATTAILIGHPTRSARDAIPEGWQGRIVDLGGLSRTPDDIWRQIVSGAESAPDATSSVLAIGNIHGQGELLLEFMERMGELR